MKLILGSSSQFRRKVLEDAGILFEVVKPEIDEKKIRTVSYDLVPVVLSYAKACAVAQKVNEPAIIIACDQVILCNDQILEKPESADDVRAWYKFYENHSVKYVNGLTVFNTETKASITAQEISTSTFKPIPEDFVEEQIRKGVIFECAGGIGDETHQAYSTIVEGSEDSIIGLPIKFVMGMVEKVK